MSTLDGFLPEPWLWIGLLAVKSTLVLLIVAGLNGALRQSSAALRSWIWVAAFGALALLPLATIGLPAIDLEVLPRTAETGVDARFEGPLPVLELPGVAEVARAEALVAGPPSEVTRWEPLRVLALLWGLGVVLALVPVARDGWLLARLRRESRPVPASWSELVAEHCRAAGVSRSVAVRWSARVTVPLVTVPWRSGLRSPVILLPRSALGWPGERLRAVLLHELAHVRRADLPMTLLVRLVCALYWPHPLVWLLARRWFFDRERACDERVIGGGVDRLAYSRFLMEAAREMCRRPDRSRRPDPSLALIRGSQLRERVGALLQMSGGRAACTGAVSARLVLIAVAAVLALGLGVAVLDLAEKPAGRADELLAALETGGPDDRRRALWGLGELEDPRTVDALIAILDDPDAEIRGLATWALGEIKEPRSLPALVATLDDPDPRAREMVVLAVGELEDPTSLPALQDLLANDPEPGVRAAAVWSLGEIGTPEAIEAVARARGDRDSQVRRSAIRVLGERSCESLPWLLAALEDPEPPVRREAARALGELGDPSGVDALIATLRDPDPEVRSWAVWALDEIRVAGP